MTRKRTHHHIANRLHDLRRRYGMSRRDLADRTGTHPETIGALERADQQPSLDMAMRISAAFDEPVQAVFYRAESAGAPDAAG
jgi:putative transcriptional regulator